MARLRFVGRPGQKFNRNDLIGKSRTKNVTENNKLNLLTKIHSGLKEFTQIAGTDSDEDETFRGFKKEDVENLLQKSADSLAQATPEEVISEEMQKKKKVKKKSKVKIKRPINKNQNERKVENDSMLSSQSGSRSLKRTTEEKKDAYFPKSRFTAAAANVSKSMKGTIKIKFSGAGIFQKLSKSRFKKSRNKRDVENEDDGEAISDEEEVAADSPPGSARKRKRSTKSPATRLGKPSRNDSKKSIISELSSKILRPLQTSRDHISSANDEEAINSGGWNKNELDQVKDMYMRAKIGGEMPEGEEVTVGARRGRKKHSLLSHRDTSPQESFRNRSSIDEFNMKSPLPHSMSSTAVMSDTPTARKVPTLEAPLICSTKRQPKPNQKFLAYSVNEDEGTQGRQRRKSQGGSELADRSPAYSVPPAGRIRDNKSALVPRNTESNSPSVFPLLEKKDKCCICGNVRASQKRIKDCKNWCCSECGEFYIDRAPKFLKGKLNVACRYEPENCNVDSSRGFNQCSSCRFKKCLLHLPSPTQIVANLRKEAREGTLTQLAMMADRQHREEGGPSETLKIISTSEMEYLERMSDSVPPKFISMSDLNLFKSRFGLNPPVEKAKVEVSVMEDSAMHSNDVAEVDEEPMIRDEKLVIDEDLDVLTARAEPQQVAPPQQSNRGPRIKHVCRDSSVALGKMPAVFGGSSLRLSALPTFEKEKILRSEDMKAHPHSEVHKKERTKGVEDVENDSGAMLDKKDRDFMPKRPSKTSTSRSRGVYKRSVRCHACERCMLSDCGKCKNCRDMPKFGGKGLIKQACEHRVCLNPGPPQSHRKKVEGRLQKEGAAEDTYPGTRRKTPKPFIEAVDVTPDPIRMSSRKPGLSRIEAQNKMEASRSLMNASLSHRVSNGSYLPATTCSVNTFLALESAVKLPENKEENYLDFAWNRGVSLVSMNTLSVRQVCKLCGSLGHSKMIYCNVCCEPFHEICMDERERPRSNKLDTWCCLQCQFCRVCFGQKDLLQCDTCQDSYHAICLSDNHPTKPSKNRKIWVCSKCVRCKSCGVTTPGDCKNSTWTHDFSLCSTCGDMMDKGNFCPVCQKCYQEDDWESQMIQCSKCICWVHSKCEELSDEMYQIVTNMPEDVPFSCRVCEPSADPNGTSGRDVAMSPWKKMISNELNKGLYNALEAAQNSCGYGVLQSLEQFQLAMKNRKPMKIKNPLSPATTLSTTSLIKNNNDLVVRGSTSETHNNPGYTDEIDVCGVDEDYENQRNEVEGIAVATTSGYLLQVAGPQSAVVNSTQMPTHVGVPLEDDVSDSEDINSLDFIKSIVSYEEKSIPSSTSSVPQELLSSNLTPGSIESSATSPAIIHSQCGVLATTSGADCGINKEDAVSLSILANGQPVVSSKSLPSILTESSTKPLDLLVSGNDAVSKADDGFSIGSNENDTNMEDDDPLLGLQSIKEKIERLEYQSLTELTIDMDQVLEGLSQMLTCDPVTIVRIQKSIKEAFYKQLSASFPWFKPNSDNTTSEKFTNVHDPDDTIMPPYPDHTYAIWKEKPLSPGPEQPCLFRKRNPSASQSKSSDDSEKKVKKKIEDERRAKIDRFDDMRVCTLCLTVGDSNEGDCGRLLYMGQNEWIHINCALWSAEVYEEADGVLQKVHGAVARGKRLRCDACGKQGATVGCCHGGCNANFHFPCARRKHCAFVESKKVFCSSHVAFADARMISSFNVDRRICLDFDNNKLFKKQWIGNLKASNICILVGSMTIESMGKLTSLSDAKYTLFPVDYCSSRLFWSTTDARKRTYYRFRVVEVQPKSNKFSQHHLGSNYDFTIPHDPNDPLYDKIVSARFAKDNDESYFSDASTLSASSEDPNEFGDANDDDSDMEAQINAYQKKQNTPKPVNDMMMAVQRNSTSATSSAPIRRGRGRPPGQRKGMIIETPAMKKSKTASLISKLRQQSSEDDATKKKQQNKLAKNQNNMQANSWQSGQQMRELLLNNSGINPRGSGLYDPGMDGGDFVDVERDDELDMDLGNRDDEDELTLVQIVDRLNKAAARNNQSRGNAAAGDQRSGVSQFFDPLDEQEWTNNVFNATQKKPSFSPVGQNFGASTSVAGQQTPICGEEANNFFLNDIQSILMMHQQQQQKEVSRPSVFYINQNTTTPQAQPQQPQKIKLATPGTPVQFLLSNQNFQQQQPQPIVVQHSNQQGIATSPQSIMLRRTSNATPVSVQTPATESTSQPKYKLILVKNVSSGRGDFKQIDQLDGNADDSDGSDQERGKQSTSMPALQEAYDNTMGSKKRKRSEDEGKESPPKRINPGSADAFENNPTSGVHFPEECSSSKFDFTMTQRPLICSVQSDSQASLESSGSEEEEEEDGDEDVDVEDESEDDDDHVQVSKPTGLVTLSANQMSQILGSHVTCEEADDEEDDDEEDDEVDEVNMSFEITEEAGRRAPADGNPEIQSKLEQTPTNSNEGSMQMPSEEKRKLHKADRIFKLTPMTHTHLPRAEVEEEIDNCLAENGDSQDGPSGLASSAHLDADASGKDGILSLEESSRVVASDDDEGKKKEEMKAKLSARYVPHLMFEITSDDGFRVLSDSVNRAWKTVIEKVKETRTNAGMKPISYAGLTGMYLSGLELPSFVYLLEQMPECRNLKSYNFKYHKEQWQCSEEELIENKHGCARCEPFTRSKHKNDMFSFLMSEHRRPPEVDLTRVDDVDKSQKTNVELPMAMRFRTLKMNAKGVVGVYRSSIHGRGLFCKRDVDAGELIIEYSGEVIRANLTDKREREYEARGIGCYMFRKDLDHVIDSTVMGNASRFINHSCEPNCYSRVIQVDNRKHIVILAQRSIKRGEELTYDYKFPIEDVKIPCLCNSRKCRKYLN